MSLFIQRWSIAFWMPYLFLRTLPEVGKRLQISGKEPHDELVVRPSGE
jgi:hypothetical protein